MGPRSVRPAQPYPLTLASAALGLAIGAVAVSEHALRDAVPPSRPDLLVPRFIERTCPAARGPAVLAGVAAGLGVKLLLAATTGACRHDDRHDHAAPRLRAATMSLRQFMSMRPLTRALTAVDILLRNAAASAFSMEALVEGGNLRGLGASADEVPSRRYSAIRP